MCRDATKSIKHGVSLQLYLAELEILPPIPAGAVEAMLDSLSPYFIPLNWCHSSSSAAVISTFTI
jgi:hypothetical protein